MHKWLANYKRNPKYFWGWLLSLLIFGLFGLWVPILAEWVKEAPIPYGAIIIQGSLSTFSIVILIEGILSDYSLPRSERSSYPITIAAFGLIAFHILFYAFTVFGQKTMTLKWTVLVLSFFALLLALYLYRFKKIDPEESAESIIEQENNEIVESANTKSSSNPIL